MVTLHEVITFLVSMQISIAACRPIMSIDVVEVVIWRESSVSGGSGAVQMFLRWQQDRKSGSAGMPRPISYAVFCLKNKMNIHSGSRPKSISSIQAHSRQSQAI